jgi:hypothetical protein
LGALLVSALGGMVVGVYHADTHVRLDGDISDRASSKQPNRILLSVVVWEGMSRDRGA